MAVPVRKTIWRGFLYMVMIIILITCLYPFFWLITTSMKTLTESVKWPPLPFPEHPTWASYHKAFSSSVFVRSIFNAIIYSVVGAFLTLLLCTMAAFGFSRYRFKVKKILFFLVLSTLMIPGQITLIPVFITINKFRWINTFNALIIPGIANGFGIFLVNQFAVDLPGDFFDSARIDGAAERLLYTKIFIPLCKPIIATLGVLEFIGRWNDFFWPLIVTNSPEMMPLTLYLSVSNREIYTILWNDLAASMVIAIIPIFIIYIFLQKYFIEGISLTSGIKG
jgi:ABC-type glycerol-3-phosphate transport system permease component